MADMDTWGYSFRLGDTRSWFERDAEDAMKALDGKDFGGRTIKVNEARPKSTSGGGGGGDRW